MNAARREEDISVRRWVRMAVVRDGVFVVCCDEEEGSGVGIVVETSVWTRTRVSIVVYT